jgi:fimbrial chaperone protein
MGNALQNLVDSMERSFGPVVRLLAATALMAAGSAPALAGSFDVNPIRVDLTAQSRTSVVKVKNTGDDPVVVQINVQAWSQNAGKDVLTTTNDVIVSPPIATIPPGQEQIVRVGLRRAPDGQRELSYRMFLQEVPPPPRPGFQGLVVALRVGLPVFVQPRQVQAKAILAWNLDMAGPETAKLRLDNTGTGHIQVSTIELFRPSEKQPVAEFSGLAYVLPGQARDWELKLRDPSVRRGERLRMKVSTDAGSIETEIELGGT